ncbi:MAG: V-type ATP synthase subunit D, partial [Euryarchaeota archaeon]|nr:V-type ATP synthase subunit D [Euryarchaeota archaeon]
PTRMELLKLKSKGKLAVKGHKLLKEKRDALIMEFFRILDEAKGAREKAEEELKDGFRALILAQATLGPIKVAEVAGASRPSEELEAVFTNIMGVRVPVLRMEGTARKFTERGYGITDTSSKLDEAAARFEAALAAVVHLAEVEKSITLLAKDIESTKRRVNALENIIIPRLQKTIKYITLRLDEMERENFFKLKRIKGVMEAKES